MPAGKALRAKRWILGIGLACATAAPLALWFGWNPLSSFVLCGCLTWPFRATFDADRWRNAGDTYKAQEVRDEMAEDLMRHHLRIGMTRQEVEALLGPADDVYDGGRRLRYWLAAHGFTPIDEDVLDIDFDDAGKLVHAQRRGT